MFKISASVRCLRSTTPQIMLKISVSFDCGPWSVDCRLDYTENRGITYLRIYSYFAMVKGMGRFLLTAWFVGVWVLPLFSQDFLYSTRNYSAADGLPQSQITDLIEDYNGYLWMGTEGGGLARFDGREFKVYTTRDGLLANEVF